MLRVLLLLLALQGLLSAQDIFKGEIVSVQKYNLVNQPVPYLHFILHDKGVNYLVEAGPEWYIQELGLMLTPRSVVEVIGKINPSEHKNHFVAQEIRQNGVVFKLRSKEGLPLWSNCSD